MSGRVVLRWFAHALGLASTLLLLAFMFGGAESMRPSSSELLMLLFFPGGVILGFVVAWWREEPGGWVTVASLAIFYGIFAARSQSIPTTPYFLLFALPGFLHLIGAYWAKWESRSPKNRFELGNH